MFSVKKLVDNLTSRITHNSPLCIHHSEAVYAHVDNPNLSSHSNTQDLAPTTTLTTLLPSKPLDYKIDLPDNTSTPFATSTESHPIVDSHVPSKSYSFGDFIHNGYDLYANYVEPYLTKHNVDHWLTSNLSFTTYYAMTGGATDFLSRGVTAAGFKTFTALFSPAISQFVEAFTETHINNAKYSYFGLHCLTEGSYCSEFNTFSRDPLSSNLLEDFSQFNFQRYYQDVLGGLEKISLSGLFYTGSISATASGIKDYIFNEAGLTPYCQGYFCKNWIGYYFKEWIKSELKSDIAQLQEGTMSLASTLGENTLSMIRSIPISFESVITTKETSFLESSTNASNTSGITTTETSAAVYQPSIVTMLPIIPITTETLT